MAINEKTFTAGAVLTASDVNTYLMNQAVKYSTAGSRPASPAEGQVIYDRDTDSLLVYTTATTGWRAPWNMPWGYITHATASGSDQTGITTETDMTGVTVTFTAVTNRRYRITAWGLVYTTGTAGTIATKITNAANAVVAPGGSSSCDTRTISDQVSFMVTSIATFTAGSTTVKARVAQAGATTAVVFNSSAPAVIMVEDIGPSGAPA
jgi:hypothetical protein